MRKKTIQLHLHRFVGIIQESHNVTYIIHVTVTVTLMHEFVMKIMILPMYICIGANMQEDSITSSNNFKLLRQ